MFRHDKAVLRHTSNASATLSFLERRLSLLTSSRRETESKEEIRGPLGLNLLHEPTETFVDFVFVHGLGGGSRKTWSKSEDPAHFWPKEWLPAESRFKNVRINSYGYNADWGEKKGSVLNIHDFGEALLADISNSPHIRTEGDSPIVLIGHSMGGLVIKKAYILAKQDPNYQILASRIHSMFFLATPHRGADSAQLLSNILRASMSHNSKAYINDLIPNSGAIQVINDEFRHLYQGSQIWSFFETVKTNLGVSQDLIVTKESAVLGLPRERIQLLNADHRHVCKFEGPSDNNYLVLRNAFVSTVDSIENYWLSSKKDEHRSQMKLLSRFLGEPESPEGDLMSVTDKQMEGSCQWLTNRREFHNWQEGCHDQPKYFWLSGKPASGKSTIAGHVIKHLEDCNRDCNYYFFKHGDKARSSISGLLRSLAYQMAVVNFKVRRELLEMQQEGESFDKDDERTIWRAIFVTRIFRTDFHQPHYWVIDALDECKSHSGLFPMLSKIDRKVPLRIFLTSRPSSSIEKLFLQEKISVTSEQMNVENSLKDIRLFLEANTQFLPLEDDLACNILIEQILEKSHGCFLWAALVLRELETTHSEQQVQEVLENVPIEMDQLYTRILENMISVPRNKKLAKAILNWTICAARPLTTEELKEALRLDINETIPCLEKTVESVCGHLIHVDRHSRVQVVHQTVRAFLIQESLESEFAVNRAKEHSRLAEVCLKYLSGEEMKTSRYRRGSAATRLLKRSSFVDYASLYFSEHIARSHSSIDTQLIMLDSFLKTNVLTWIETIARGGNLYFLTQTAKNLKAYLERRAKYRSPLGQAVQAVEVWANDLIRIVTAFGKSLLSSPTSIHFLIPPVCPPESIIYRSFKDYPRCLEVVGLSEKDWEDRLSCFVFPEDQATAISCRDSRIAVGLSNGTIMLYHTNTCQEAGKLEHGEPIRFLEFATINTFLASSGRTMITLWSINTRTLLWTTDTGNQLLALSFNEDDSILMAATRANHVMVRKVSDGAELDNCPFCDIVENDQTQYQRPPSHAEFSMGLGLLAIGYRQRPISFWDLEDNSFMGQFWKSGVKTYPGPLLVAMKFNPNPVVNLVAASYQDGDLVVFDPWNQKQHALVEANAHVLAASPDGRTLATGDGTGTVQLFDFETLKLMYRTSAYEYDIRAIVFASNSLRFFDIRGDHYNVWEPSVLVRRTDSGDDQSETFSEEIPTPAQFVGTRLWDDGATVTSCADHHEGQFMFCGRENGSIDVLEVKTGKVLQELCSHTNNVAIWLLAWNKQEGLLTSTDSSGRFLTRKVSRQTSGSWVANGPQVDSVSAEVISQIVVSPSGKHLLVSTAMYDELWSTEGYLIQGRRAAQRSSWKWISHPNNPDHVLLISDSVARIFSWGCLDEISTGNGILLDVKLDTESPLTDLISYDQGRSIYARFSGARGSRAVPQLRVWPASQMQPEAELVRSLMDYNQLAMEMKVIIGIYKSSLVFLDHNGWVCSLQTEAVGIECFYIKHFLIPFSWHSTGEIICRITAKGSVALARRDQVAIFHKGLDFEEKVRFG